MFSVRTFTGVTTADRMRPRPDGCGSRLQALPLYHGRGDGHGMQNPSLIRNARRRLSLRSIIERSTRRRPLVVLTTTRWRSVNASEQYEQIEDDDDYFEFNDQVEPVTAEELEAALAAEKAEASRRLKEARAKAAEVEKEEAKARAEEKHGPVFVAKSEEDLVAESEEEEEDEEEAGRAFPVVAKKEQAADEDADAAETLRDSVEDAEEEEEEEEEEEVDAQTALVDAMAEFEEAKAAWLAAAAEAALGDVAAAAEAKEARAKLEEMAAIAGAAIPVLEEKEEAEAEAEEAEEEEETEENEEAEEVETEAEAAAAAGDLTPNVEKAVNNVVEKAVSAAANMMGKVATGGGGSGSGDSSSSSSLPPEPPGDASSSSSSSSSEREVAELTSTVRDLKKRMGSLAKLLDEAVTRRDDLERDIEAERASAAAVEQKQSEKIKVLKENIEAIMADQSSHKESLAKTKADKDKERAELESRRADIEAELEKVKAAAKKKAEDQSATIGELSAQLSNVRDEVAAYKTKLAQSEKETEEARETLETRQRELEEEMAREKAAMDEEIAKQQKTLLEVAEELKNVKAEVTSYKSQLDDAKAETAAAVKQLGITAASVEKKVEKRLDKGRKKAEQEAALAAKAEVDRMVKEAADALASAKAIEMEARNALDADKKAAAESALVKAEKEIEAAHEARDAAKKLAADAERQLKNQNELLNRVDELIRENGDVKKTVAQRDEAIEALQKETKTLREMADEATKLAVKKQSEAEAAEEKVAEKVTQTLEAAETCVTTAERVRQEVENSAVSAAELAAEQLAAAKARYRAAEENLKNSNAKLEEMTKIAMLKESVDQDVEELTRETAKMTDTIAILTEDLRIAKEYSTNWEGKAVTAQTELEKRLRELSEAEESAVSWKVQVTSAVARADHAEGLLRKQTELLDEMAEMAAEKESAEAQCVALSQTADAQAREIDRLAAEAKSAREAAVEWETKALAAAAKVETRASVAEEAARKAEESAREKQRIIEEADLVCAGVADEEAVAAAVDSQLGAIKGDADYKVYEATRNVDALRRALAASAFSAQLWQERAENAGLEIAKLREEMDYAIRGSKGLDVAASDDKKKANKAKKDSESLELSGANSTVPIGRLTRAAFASGKDLRSFVTLGPRIEPARDPTVTKELDAVGLGAPILGDYTRVDRVKKGFTPPARNNNQNGGGHNHDNNEKPKRRIPVMTWDVEQENRNKQSLSFNPRRLGKVTQGMDKYVKDEESEGIIQA